MSSENKFGGMRRILTIFMSIVVFNLYFSTIVSSCAGGWSHTFNGLTETILFPQHVNDDKNEVYYKRITTRNASWMKFEECYENAGAGSVKCVKNYYPYTPMYVPPDKTNCCSGVCTGNGCTIGYNPEPHDLTSLTYNTSFLSTPVYLTNLRGCEGGGETSYCFNSINHDALCKQNYYDRIYFNLNQGYVAGYKANPINNLTSDAGYILINDTIYRVSVDNTTEPFLLNINLSELKPVHLNLSGFITTDPARVGMDITINDTYIERIWTDSWTDSAGNYQDDIYLELNPGAYTIMIQASDGAALIQVGGNRELRNFMF
ncbi:MAG TPA: hypothetical protein EYP86_05030 [Candidatus Altiarchaeales archaeon]|nr:hypothetical protein [Candidatus Altiarchaeales archaeon]